MEYKEKDSVVFSHLGRKWKIYRADMELLWETMEQDQEAMQAFENDERLPYWAELWPSSFGLADWLEKNSNMLAGRHCMDLGCGLGFTALCGAELGARVLACDYEEKALDLALFNAEKNGIKACFAESGERFWEESGAELFCMPMDWRLPKIPEKSFSVIWAADIAYERKFMPEILKFLDYALTENGVFWIAEPSRTVYRSFLEEVKVFPFVIEKVFSERTRKISENILPADVNIWQIVRK